MITVFMILFGVNFNLYFLIRLKNWKDALKNEELHAYLGIIAGAVAIVTVNILGIYGNIVHAFRYASFQVASVITTTGFCTADFNLSPIVQGCIIRDHGDRSVCRIYRRRNQSISFFDPCEKYQAGSKKNAASESSNDRKDQWKTCGE